MLSRFCILLVAFWLSAGSSAPVNAAPSQCQGASRVYCKSATSADFSQLERLQKRLISRDVPRIAQNHVRWVRQLAVCNNHADRDACIVEKVKRRYSFLKVQHKLQTVSHIHQFNCAVSSITVRWYDTPAPMVWVQTATSSQLMFNVAQGSGLTYENKRSRLWVHGQKAMIWVANQMPHQECARVTS